MAEYRADYPSTYASVTAARRSLVQFARLAGLGGEELGDFEFAVGEALANAAEHGHRDGSHFTVRAETTGGVLVVDIKDGGRGFAGWNAAEYIQPLSSAPRGFGIFIMRSLMDQLEYSESGSRIRLMKRLRQDASSGEQREA